MVDYNHNIDNPCPVCGATDLGEVIPPEVNTDECYGPQGTRWRLHMGLEDPMLYDGISQWQCWSCKHCWDRFKWMKTKGEESVNNSD